MAVNSTSSLNGFVKNSTAPAFMAWTVMGTSPWPVMKMIGISVRSAATRSLQVKAIEARKRNVKYEAVRNKNSWMVEEFLRGRECLRLPAFTADQQFQRFAHGDVIVDNEDDWCDLQHLRSPHFMAKCVHLNSCFAVHT